MRGSLLFLAAAACLTSGPAHANYFGSCTITVMSGGRMMSAPDLLSLGSRNPGGSSGLVQVKAEANSTVLTLACTVGLPTNCPRVSLRHPLSFAGAPAGNSDVSFSGRLDLVSGTSPLLLRREVDDVVILNGTYEFSVDLTAQKTDGVFSTGDYEAIETIRCE